MTTLKDARKLWQEKIGQYEAKRPYRTAVLGDGRGTAASNLYVPGTDGHLWARDTVDSRRFFSVLNRDGTVPAFNLPVMIGYKLTDPRQEQILGVHFAGLPQGILPSGTGIIGSHHPQHEFRGGDEVFIDGRLFMPGLVRPTTPRSMQVVINQFIYFWDSYKSFLGATSKDLSVYIPSTGNQVYVLIGLDPVTGELVYRPGNPFGIVTPEAIFQIFSTVPAPSGNEIPLAYILIYSTTTTLDWSASQSNIFDGRLHAGYPALNILDRLRQLEGYTGNEPSIATTGAGTNTVSDVDHTLNGLTDVDTTGVSDGQTIVFNQATNRYIPGTAGAGSFTINFNNNPILTGQTTLVQGTGASLSQSGASITIGATGGGATVYPSTPAGVGASPNAGVSASAAAGDHIHRGVLSILSGTGASVETSTAGCVTIGMTGSGWASANQVNNRATNTAYLNGSLTRLVLAVYAGSPTLTALARVRFLTGPASPPGDVIDEYLLSGFVGTGRDGVGGIVLPSQYYIFQDNSQVGASINMLTWKEYDDYGGAPAGGNPYTYYNKLASLLEPDAIVYKGGLFSHTLTASQTYLMTAAYATKLGANGRFEVRDPKTAIPLRGVTINGTSALSGATFIDPTLPSYPDSQSTYFSRLDQLASETTLSVSVSAASQSVPLLPGPYGAIITGVTLFDLAWISPQISSSGFNFTNELGDQGGLDYQRNHNTLNLAVNKTNINRVLAGEAKTGGSPLGTVTYYLVGSAWGKVANATSYIFREDFMNDTLNTATSWTRTESTVGNVEINTNYRWLKVLGNNVWGGNGLYSQSSFGRDAGRIYQCDVYTGEPGTTPNLIVGFMNGTGNADTDIVHGVDFSTGSAHQELFIFEGGTNRGQTGDGWQFRSTYRVRITLGSAASNATYEIQGGKYNGIGGSSWKNISPGTTSASKTPLRAGATQQTATITYLSDMQVR